MFIGYIESEALNNPTVLNKYHPIKIDVEFVPTSKNYPYVHAYYLSFKQNEVNDEAEFFSKQMKKDWYLLFWDEKEVFAIFQNKVFKIDFEQTWNSEKYREIQNYGVSHGIGIEYLDFNKNFKRFNEVLSKK